MQIKVINKISNVYREFEHADYYLVSHMYFDIDTIHISRYYNGDNEGEGEYIISIGEIKFDYDCWDETFDNLSKRHKIYLEIIGCKIKLTNNELYDVVMNVLDIIRFVK